MDGWIANHFHFFLLHSLLVMDDNQYFVEWLAYHYHVMPLRRLIAAIDPKSITSPIPILNRWKVRIDITVWNDADTFPNGAPRPSHLTGSTEYMTRQRAFIGTCLKRLKQEDRGWTLITDTDEYTLLNPLARDPSNPSTASFVTRI